MEIYNLKDKLEYLDEVVKLEYEEWAKADKDQKEERLSKKKDKIMKLFPEKNFCKLILVNNNDLIGFISLFPTDGEEEQHLTPWYATMYVKEKFRNNGYSKILNDAILEEAKSRGYKTVYLKTELKNYYEKFGAVFIKKLKNKESLYKIDL